MSKIYVAARYSRHPEMQGVRDVLQGIGHTVTSRWIDQHGGDQLESATAAQLNTDPGACGVYGQHDIEDLAAADIVISFTDAAGGGKGGRHIEFGYALATGKRMILVGPRENIFHTLPEIEHYDSWPDLIRLSDLGSPVITVPTCSLCRRERLGGLEHTMDAYDYHPIQAITGQPLGWYSGYDGEVCPECMTRTMRGDLS